MNKKHLLWIVPVVLVLGFISGVFISSAGFSIITQEYPIINCIKNLDMSLNPNTNKLPFTVESQQEAIQWRCAKETVNFSITDYEDIFVLK